MVETPKYAIRTYEFAYTDEYYLNAGDLGSVEAMFEDEASAKAEWQRLVVARLRAEDALHHYVPFWEPSDDFIDGINAFCIERCGEPLVNDGDYGFATSIPEGLSDADVLDFAQMTGLYHYQVVELPADGAFTALWLVDEKKYAGTYSVNISYKSSVEEFIQGDLQDDHYADCPYQIYEAFPRSWRGSYEELSDNPLLLRQLVVSKSEHLAYDEASQILSLTKAAWEIPRADLFALNALLKKPVFEIRRLTVDELRAMNA